MADRDFAPFDPKEDEPPLEPRERVKRGFESLRVINREDHPGSFLYAGDMFDPAQRRFLGVPIADSAYYTRDLPAPNLDKAGRRMAAKLGAGDLDRQQDFALLAKVKHLLGHKP